MVQWLRDSAIRSLILPQSRSFLHPKLSMSPLNLIMSISSSRIFSDCFLDVVNCSSSISLVSTVILVSSRSFSTRLLKNTMMFSSTILS